MTSMHVTIKTGASGTTAAAGSSPTDMAGLQKKMVALMKELEDASKDTSPGAKERIHLLQVQIQACEMHLQQLQAAEAQKALVKQTAAASDQREKARDVTSPLGAHIDTQA